MPTVIHFVGREQLLVREDEDQVRDAFAVGDGMPAPLTHHRSGERVYVSLGQVTYWRARSGSRREATTDSWPSLQRLPAGR